MSKDRRTRELAAIHVAKKQLALDDETYRDMLWAVGRVRSAGELDQSGRSAVIEHMRARGAKPAGNRRPKPALSKAKLIAKIRAMLIEADRTDAYADGMAKKMFGVARMEWCQDDQLHKMAAALVYDQRRRRAASA